MYSMTKHVAMDDRAILLIVGDRVGSRTDKRKLTGQHLKELGKLVEEVRRKNRPSLVTRGSFWVA
jgi:hypothetical protein